MDLAALPYDIKRLIYDLLMVDPVYLLCHDLTDAYLALYGELYIDDDKCHDRLTKSRTWFLSPGDAWNRKRWVDVLERLNATSPWKRGPVKYTIGIPQENTFALYTPGDVASVLYPMLRARPFTNRDPHIIL